MYFDNYNNSLIGVMELATVTPQIGVVSVLISMVDFSLGFVAQKSGKYFSRKYLIDLVYEVSIGPGNYLHYRNRC